MLGWGHAGEGPGRSLGLDDAESLKPRWLEFSGQSAEEEPAADRTLGTCRGAHTYNVSRKVVICARVWGQSKEHQKGLDAHTQGRGTAMVHLAIGRNL